MPELQRFITDFHRHLSRNPNDCVAKGIDAHLSELPDPSLDEAAGQVSEARELTAAARAIDGAALSFDDRLDVELATLVLEAEIHGYTHTFNGKPHLAQCPRAGDEIGDGIFLMFINDPRPAGDRLANITGRLEAVPDYVEGLLARLDVPVARWVKMDMDKVAELPQLFASVAELADDESWPDRPRLGRAREAAEAALRSYAERLGRIPTTTQLHLAEEDARRIVALRGIDRSLEDLHRMAAVFLADTAATIEELRGRLAAKYDLAATTSVEDVHAFLNRRYRVELPNKALSDVLERYRSERDRVVAFIRERDLFPIPDDQDMKIMQTPGFMAPSIPAGAMMSPPPFRGGVRTSLVYLTLSDELLDEHTDLDIPNMIIHEGIPGHHLQLSSAAAHPSVIRRHVDAMEQAEGWTTMLEDYMLDIGYMGDLTDEARFCGKRDISRIGARVAIDLFFMTGDRSFLDVGVDCDLSPDDPFVAAGNLLHAVTGFVPGRVQAELNWYSQERGYPLCYLTGNRMVWELKADVERTQAGQLSGHELDRKFHDVYLRAGSMPVSFLRRVFAHAGLTSEA